MARAWIPIATVRDVTKQPCAVCGVPYDTQCDHVISVAAGGTNESGNLQSLCSQCNKIKHARKSNSEVAIVVLARGARHFKVAVWRNDTRHLNAYSRPGMDEWMASRPDRAEVARRLHADFLTRAA